MTEEEVEVGKVDFADKEKIAEENLTAENTSLVHTLPTMEKRKVMPDAVKNISELERQIQDLAAELSNFAELRNSVEQMIEDNNRIFGERSKEFFHYYNTLREVLEKIQVNFQKEFDVRTLLEEQAQHAEKRMMINTLRKELDAERAKITLLTDNLTGKVEETLVLLNNKIGEIKSTEDAVNSNLSQFRQGIDGEMVNLTEKSKKAIDDFSKNSVATLERLQNISLDFLRQCSAANQDLIKKVPKVSAKYSKKDILIYSLSVTAIVCVLLNIIFLFR